MKASLADVEGLADSDLAWRRIEMHTLRSELLAAARQSANSPKTRTLSRALVALAYAHWEGYVKAMLERVTSFLIRPGHPVASLNDDLVALYMSALLDRFRSGDESARGELVQLARGGPAPSFKVNRGRLADTAGNLRYPVLERLFGQLGVPLSDFETRRNLIDVLLCDRRNAIAHGREEFLDAEDASQVAIDVLVLMEDVRDQLLAYVRAGRFRA